MSLIFVKNVYESLSMQQSYYVEIEPLRDIIIFQFSYSHLMADYYIYFIWFRIIYAVKEVL